MTRRFASLKTIDNDRQITKETDDLFLHQLQSGLLLAIKERGCLNEMQYRHAQERLNQQRRDRMKRIQQQGGRK